MATRANLPYFVIDALMELGGRGSVLEVSKKVWEMHGSEQEQSGDLFFTWQYDIRWAAQSLRDAGQLVKMNGDRRGIWTLAEPTRREPSA